MRKEEGLGWASEGWSVEKAALQRGEIIKAYITGEGARSLNEKRQIEKERRKTEKQKFENVIKEQITVSQFFHEKYYPLAQTDKKRRSCQSEEWIFRLWIEPVIGKIPLKDVTSFHIEKIKKNLLDAGRKPRTIEYMRAVVRQIWNCAVRNGIVNGKSPTFEVKIPKCDNERQRFLTHEEAALLLKALKKRSVQVFQMAFLSLNCGLRAGEIFNLTWTDVSLEKGFLTLRDTKNGKSGIAFMTQEVREMFEKMNPKVPNEFIFKNLKGEKMKFIAHIFEKVVAECGLNNGIIDTKQKVVFHTLRHTYASWLVESGVDLYTVQKLMRHATLAMTQRYAHLGQNTLQSAVRRLETAIKGVEKVVNI
jgi:site-specific recombinase XerD